MKINGTILNYYFHCKRQCYLFANRINLEENSEEVRIGRVLHEIKAMDSESAEIKYDNMVIDKMTNKHVEEFKKSDADVEAAKMQLLFYLKNLEAKGIKREGKLVFAEKTKQEKIEKIVLNEENKKKIEKCMQEIEELIKQEEVPEVEKQKGCSKCAYYSYCYI